ncbi:MAG: four-carbon acid sugar kinase family protein [Gloeomargarita sp. GMQP_bins_120]
MPRPKLVVLDDDPTGSQTVHSCLLLLRWDPATLQTAWADASPLFFILGNTRACTPDKAAQITREICCHLRQVVGERLLDQAMIISRSDSTLRGHYPLEVEVLNEELGPFDGHLLIPAFIEGGRITRNSTHYLLVNGQPVPVDQTEFARDTVFGYPSAYLPAYVEYKTGGRIRQEQVLRLTLEHIRSGRTEDLLLGLQNNACAVVDAETEEDLQRVAQALYRLQQQGKRLLLRSAAGIVRALAQLPPQPVAPAAMSTYVQGQRPGVVVVGSHVQLSTQQVEHLLRQPGVQGIELAITGLLQGQTPAEVVAQVLPQITQALHQGLTPVIYTPRQELTFPDQETRLHFGAQVAQTTALLVQQLPPDIGFLVSKGGITSNTILSDGLQLTAVRLLGQIAPGINVIRTPADHPRFPQLPVVIVPGNVGGPEVLTTIVQRLDPRQA